MDARSAAARIARAPFALVITTHRYRPIARTARSRSATCGIELDRDRGDLDGIETDASQRQGQRSRLPGRAGDEHTRGSCGTAPWRRRGLRRGGPRGSRSEARSHSHPSRLADRTAAALDDRHRPVRAGVPGERARAWSPRIVASAPIGARQPPPDVSRNARSASTAVRVRTWSIAAARPSIRASSRRIWMAIAP